MGYSERQDCRYASLYSITQLIKQIKNSQLLSSLLWICQICKRKKEKKTGREGGRERVRERSLLWDEYNRQSSYCDALKSSRSSLPHSGHSSSTF